MTAILVLLGVMAFYILTVSTLHPMISWPLNIALTILLVWYFVP